MYKFIGDATKFYNEANQVSLNPFLDKIDQLKERIEELNNTDLSYEDLNQSQYIQNERGGWDVNYDFGGNVINSIHDYGIVNFDDSEREYTRIFKNKFGGSNELQLQDYKYVQ